MFIISNRNTVAYVEYACQKTNVYTTIIKRLNLGYLKTALLVIQDVQRTKMRHPVGKMIVNFVVARVWPKTVQVNAYLQTSPSLWMTALPK